MKSIVGIVWSLIFLLMLLVSCQSSPDGGSGSETGLAPLSLPQVSAVSLNNRPLTVVATTSIIGDVVGRVGGDTIDLTALMTPGQDPHSYEPSSGDLAAVADADVIFVNGWNLEEGLIANLENAAGDSVFVPVSAGINPIPFGGHAPEEDEEQDSEAEAADPHVWLDPHNVVQWVDNIAQILAALDPANAESYRQNADQYRAELQTLIQHYDEQVAAIPAEDRVLITNHDSFGYFAAAYDFEIIGTVLPGAGALAEPSATDLAELVQTMQRAGICTIFAETTANTDLAETAAAELSNCDSVAVIPLYTGALGPPGSGADSYIMMMEANINALKNGLTEDVDSLNR